jgi:hypothetical protein
MKQWLWIIALAGICNLAIIFYFTWVLLEG